MESRTGAGLIAGMLQGTKHISFVWDKLPQAAVEEFLRAWAHELDNWKAGPTDAIIESISRHDALREACWMNDLAKLGVT